MNIAIETTAAIRPDARSPTVARRPLHLDLRAAADLLGCVLTGQSLASALPQLAKTGHWSAAERGAAQALSFEVLRGLGRAQALLAALHPKRIKPPELEQLLLVAIALLSAPRSPQADSLGAPPLYPDHTLINQAVQACVLRPKTRHARGLVNALLRRLQTERENLLQAVMQGDPARYNHPDWWVQRMRAAYPQDWANLLDLAAQRPAMTLRVNARWGDRGAYLALLRAQGMEAAAPATPGLEQALILHRPVPVQDLPLFDVGAVSVQDASAQFAAGLLDARDGMRVLDACAAPGGKTAHILERADCEVLALDHDATRAERIGATLARLRLPQAQVVAANAAQTASWWDGRAFDRILLDAPCSASGIVRRHPDIRWLRQDADIPALAVQQAALLEALWPLLAPGGQLLYATCSVFPEEGSEQAAAFLRRHDDALAWTAPGQILPSRSPERDGFYYALFAKRTEH
ncbi:Ribosomal RNA small subunit methyltransferase B [Thiomonas sp. X19]|uniref:16S rRNA (cytosine(967)-C(5))-methyltransferase RsmB n=1 Tax=Thiomonas sp. X19 TaxID=1050370 RepID=UPI000B6D5700|nr:16S rRNA (cytosine(967)-C(5))-methyltransferase RsmB [Thiomonas sp. X19]SCC95874.1 Ribosomal RNA small subunit methyltransferase B [Thiomonas sp. X19]